MDLSKLQNGLVKVVTWICQSCYVDLSKMFYVFLALCQAKPTWSLTNILKLVEASALNWRCWRSQVLNGLGPDGDRFCFSFFQSVFKRHHNRFAVGLQAWDERRHPRNGRREAGEENGRWDWRDRGQNEKVKDVRKTTSFRLKRWGKYYIQVNKSTKEHYNDGWLERSNFAE